jgi:hypothetical protein
MQTEDAGDNNNSEHQEGAEDNDDSILDSLSSLSDDVSPMASEEYERYCKELEDAEKEDGESSPPKQVFMTLAGIDDEDDNTEKTPPRAKIPDSTQPEAPLRVRSRKTPEPSQGRSLKFYEGMVADTFMEIAGKHGEHVQQPEILTTPITPEVAADLEALEGKRKQLLAESNKIFKVTASVLEDKMETKRLYEQAKQNERLAEEELVRARELAEEWKTTVKETHEEARQMQEKLSVLATSTLTVQLVPSL